MTAMSRRIPVPARGNALTAQMPHQLPAPVERIRHVQLVHAPHQRQVLGALPLRPVVLRRPAHAQQPALPRKTQRSVPLDHPPPLRPAQRLSPRRKKSRSTVSSPIFACRSRILASCSRAALRPAPPANTSGSPSSSCRFPCGHLVRMKLVPRGDRLHAVPARAAPPALPAALNSAVNRRLFLAISVPPVPSWNPP